MGIFLPFELLIAQWALRPRTVLVTGKTPENWTAYCAANITLCQVCCSNCPCLLGAHIKSKVVRIGLAALSGRMGKTTTKYQLSRTVKTDFGEVKSQLCLADAW